MSEQYGTIIDVSTVNVGDHLAADAALSATTIFVTDATVFDEIGGRLWIAENVYSYIAVDLALNSITLTTGLLGAALTDERVELYPSKPVKYALIDFAIDEGEAVQAVVPHNLVAVLIDGMREEADREVALVEERSSGELYVKDLLAKTAEIVAYPTELGDAVDLDIYIEPGVFVQTQSSEAATGANYPVDWAGILEVFNSPAGPLVVQRYSAYRNDYQVDTVSVWSRAYANSIWSPWAPLHDDTGWITTIADVAVASTGWSIAQAAIRRINRDIHFRLFVTRTGTAITVPVHGNIADSDLFQMVTDWRPGGTVAQGVISGSSDRTVAAVIGTDGTVTLTAIGAGIDIATSNTLAVGGVYLMDV